jgi:nitrate reductase NapE component
MLIPTGPPAMKLTALADVNNAPDSEKLSIAKFLTIAYAISPLIAFAVVGSLKASEAVINAR